MFGLSPAVATVAINLLLANLPAVIQTGAQVFAFLKAGITHLETLFANSTAPVTVEDVRAALTKEALEAIQIAAIP